jgi:hypothetical protein
MSNSLDRNDALEILKLALDDIERIKQQQWRDFYAVLAVQGGLLVLFKDHLSLRMMFVILSLLAGLLGAFLIRSSQHRLEQTFRARKNRALAALGKEFIVAWGGMDPLARSRIYPNTCLVVVGLGTALTILLMLKFPPALF